MHVVLGCGQGHPKDRGEWMMKTQYNTDTFNINDPEDRGKSLGQPVYFNLELGDGLS
jgi:hypothetical protein